MDPDDMWGEGGVELVEVGRSHAICWRVLTFDVKSIVII